MKISGLFIVSVSILLVLGSACSLLPGRQGMPANINGVATHERKLQTRGYSGDRGAVVFTLHNVDAALKGVTDRLIRVFAENDVPLDVAIRYDCINRQPDFAGCLREFADAGIIDISLDGRDINWLAFDTPDAGKASKELGRHLVTIRQQMADYFGSPVTACIFPYEALNEYNYNVLQDSGFRTMTTQAVPGFVFSRQPVNWAGTLDTNALSRIPIVAAIDYTGAAGGIDYFAVHRDILRAIEKDINSLGTATIELEPYVLAKKGDEVDAAKIQQMGNLVRLVKEAGEVITFTAWNRYGSRSLQPSTGQRVLPAYNGGTAIIFRLDDVCKGFYEDTDQAIIEIFRRNGVPIDCGVIPNANGVDTYDIPWLKQYVDDGIAGISVHGFDWDYYQLDTSRSGFTYEQIKFKLLRAYDECLQYYGVSPVALTVPTDFYDETGYAAVNDAGFKIFATQIAIDPHPSAETVDFNGKWTSSGMYRIPTAIDVSEWDGAKEEWGETIDVSGLLDSGQDCKYYLSLSTRSASADFAYSVCQVLSKIGVSAISIHPRGFVDANGKPDTAKLNKLEKVVQWAKSFAAITTFEQWYNYTSSR